eukprot:1085524_1
MTHKQEHFNKLFGPPKKKKRKITNSPRTHSSPPKKNIKPQKIYKHATHVRVLLYLHYMADVLTIMSSISKWFQSKNNKMQIYGSLNFEIHVLAEALDQLSHTKSKGKYFTLFQSMVKRGEFV